MKKRNPFKSPSSSENSTTSWRSMHLSPFFLFFFFSATGVKIKRCVCWRWEIGFNGGTGTNVEGEASKKVLLNINSESFGWNGSDDFSTKNRHRGWPKNEQFFSLQLVFFFLQHQQTGRSFGVERKTKQKCERGDTNNFHSTVRFLCIILFLLPSLSPSLHTVCRWKGRIDDGALIRTRTAKKCESVLLLNDEKRTFSPVRITAVTLFFFPSRPTHSPPDTDRLKINVKQHQRKWKGYSWDCVS